jgi:hypothetical protein
VHVTLRQLPHTDNTPPNKVRVELSVVDTGKVCSCSQRDCFSIDAQQGISQNFLKVGFV